MSSTQPFGSSSTQSQEARSNTPFGSQALVIAVGGVGGLDWCGLALRHLLKSKHPHYEVQIVDWGLGFGRWYADLSDIKNRDARAFALAEMVRLYKIDHPEFPIYIVAKSGGCGVAVRALEQLGRDTAERVVLLAPALSARYNLTRALRAVKREMFVFWSPLDVIVLGVGTRLFGTIDRVKTVAAGLIGFKMPCDETADPDQTREYQKLRQIRWQFRMAARGYFGGHMGPDSPLFLGKYVLPLLRIEETTTR